jgi:hypothetical protein
MSDTNTSESNSAKVVRKLYATRSECEASKTEDTPKTAKPIEVFVNEVSKGWLYAVNHDLAIAHVARMDGYSASSGQRSAPVTKEAVAAKLADFTDDELQALGLSRKPAKRAKN